MLRALREEPLREAGLRGRPVDFRSQFESPTCWAVIERPLGTFGRHKHGILTEIPKISQHHNAEFIEDIDIIYFQIVGTLFGGKTCIKRVDLERSPFGG